MNNIVFAIIVLALLGLAGGVILVLASKFMAVYEDPRIAQITACLAASPPHGTPLPPRPTTPAGGRANQVPGPAVNTACKAGCIGCGLCVRNCPSQAITLVNNLAVIDYSKCTACGTCVTKCPKKVIHWVDGAPATAEAPASK